jgi:LysR family glycine cleavage system transcriptional activator
MNDWLPSLNALRAFEAVARHRSYKKAADELNVTPAAVKQLTAKLEKAIGEPLLERHGHSMELTRTGAQGNADLTNGFKQISLAVERMRTNAKDTRLIVSVDPSFAAAWLVPRLQDFKLSNPGIEVLIDSSMQIADLNNGSADIGIRFGVESHRDLISNKLFDEQLCTLCSPALAKGPPEITRIEDLKKSLLLRWDLSEFEWASTTRRWNYWKTWLNAVGADHVKPGLGAKFNDYNLAVQAAIAGQGFILGSRPILKHLIDSNLLVDPFSISASPGLQYEVVTTKAALSREDVNRFIEWILKCVEK